MEPKRKQKTRAGTLIQPGTDFFQKDFGDMNAAEEAVREALAESGFEFHHEAQAQPDARQAHAAGDVPSALQTEPHQTETRTAASSRPAVPAPTMPAAALDAVRATSEPTAPAQDDYAQANFTPRAPQAPAPASAAPATPLINGERAAYSVRATRSHAPRARALPTFISPSSGASSNVSYVSRDSRGSFTSRTVASAAGFAAEAGVAGTGAAGNGAYPFANRPYGHVAQRPRVLAIAGTDPTGGAGILADMKSIMACGGYGMGVVTSVVAQNTCRVDGIWPQSAEAISAQLQAVSSDVSIDSIKIGMMGTADAINAVHEWLEDTDFTQMGGLWRKSHRTTDTPGVITMPIPQGVTDEPQAAQTVAASATPTDADGRPLPSYHNIKQRVSGKQRPWVVLDPVMISTSGTRLLDPAAEGALAELLTSGLIDVLTPNLPELAALVGQPVAQTWEEAVEQGSKLLAKLGGSTRIYVKTGHLENSASRADAFIDACTMRAISRNPVVTRLPGIKIDTRNTHGTGCALSSALATFRPQSKDWLEAAQRSKAWIRGTIKHADELGVGLGNGPINHAWNLACAAPIDAAIHQNVTSNVLRRGM